MSQATRKMRVGDFRIMVIRERFEVDGWLATPDGDFDDTQKPIKIGIINEGNQPEFSYAVVDDANWLMFSSEDLDECFNWIEENQ